MSQFEQRANIKFCVRLGKSFSETFDMLKEAYVEESMSRTQVYEWHRRFKSGRESLEDYERVGRPATSRNEETIARVREIIRNDRRQSIDDVAEIVGISHGSCYSILHDDGGNVLNSGKRRIGCYTTITPLRIVHSQSTST
jgi:transposase